MNMKSGADDNFVSIDQLVLMAVEEADPLIQHDLGLSQIEVIETAFSRLPEPESGKRHWNTFSAWFLDHCVDRQVRPIDALKEFQESKSALIRQIATKVMADKYAIHEHDKHGADGIIYSKSAMWAAWFAALIALLVYLDSCSSGKGAGESEAVPKAIPR
jgi:hypothetical protein